LSLKEDEIPETSKSLSGEDVIKAFNKIGYKVGHSILLLRLSLATKLNKREIALKAC
jgi:hypothetical protein